MARVVDIPEAYASKTGSNGIVNTALPTIAATTKTSARQSTPANVASAVPGGEPTNTGPEFPLLQ
jgi:hypothetical protein